MAARRDQDPNRDPDDLEPDLSGNTPAPDPLDHASAEVDLARAGEVGAFRGEARAREEVESEPPREGSRVFTFLRNCWAELKRVQWPDRRHVAQATAVVLGFVIIAGSYLGLLDAAIKPLIQAIL